jgi:hypothetical protein
LGIADLLCENGGEAAAFNETLKLCLGAASNGNDSIALGLAASFEE